MNDILKKMMEKPCIPFDETPYNILFLDFDGVINNSDLEQEKDHETIPNDWDQYHPDLVSNIRTIIHEYNLKVVVSSTWRKNHSIQSMNMILNNLWNLDCVILDYTTTEHLDKDYYNRLEDDIKASSRDRGLQISHWLNSKKYYINSYIIIDDDSDAGYGHDNHFFKTDVMRGFDNDALTKFKTFMETNKNGILEIK